MMSCGWKFLVRLLVGWLPESKSLLVHVVNVGIVGTETTLLREGLDWRHTKGLDLRIGESVLVVELIVNRRLILLGKINVESSKSSLRLLLLIHAAPLIATESIRAH